MLKYIPIMQEKNRGKNLDEKRDSAKRTTIILEEEERKFIDALIREGKEQGIKPLFSKMLDIYRSMMIYDWRFPGEYYCGISRIAFLNVELVNILIQNIPEERWREIGRKMGEASKVSMEATLGIQTSNRDTWHEVFKRLRVQGFGDFYLKDKYILVKAPFISEPKIWAGFLEGLLDIELDIKTFTAPFVFEIKQGIPS
ncbi:MAG: hypothetical protein NZ932_01665 [Candidatus Bathyarchaeota archaeon]|nr:hypothetical protein [Candidatus Bathyarchaeota archaeon]